MRLRAAVADAALQAVEVALRRTRGAAASNGALLLRAQRGGLATGAGAGASAGVAAATRHTLRPGHAVAAARVQLQLMTGREGGTALQGATGEEVALWAVPRAVRGDAVGPGEGGGAGALLLQRLQQHCEAAHSKLQQQVRARAEAAATCLEAMGEVSRLSAERAELMDAVGAVRRRQLWREASASANGSGASDASSCLSAAAARLSEGERRVLLRLPRNHSAEAQARALAELMREQAAIDEAQERLAGLDTEAEAVEARTVTLQRRADARQDRWAAERDAIDQATRRARAAAEAGDAEGGSRRLRALRSEARELERGTAEFRRRVVPSGGGGRAV